MTAPWLEVGPPALRPLDAWRFATTLAAVGICAAAAGLHGARDGQWAATGLLLAVGGAAAVLSWLRRPGRRMVALRWTGSGWQALWSGDTDPSPAQVGGIWSSPRGLLLRVRATAPGPVVDDLLWIDGPSLGEPRWTHLRSTLRLAPPSPRVP
ncbi:MAG: hypothetical protein MUC74_12245 [Ideonella sp.]|nr:hypothetical protein [Ideonella sp.]